MKSRRLPLLLAAFVAAFVCAASLGCTRATESGSSGAASSAAPSAAPRGEEPRPSVRSQRAAVFRGSYRLEPGEIYVPGKGDVPNAKEWEGVKWRGDDAGTELGTGSIEFRIDESTGRVSGKLGGASGLATLSGIVQGDQVSATITRQDVSDMGLTGTLVGKRAGESVEGTIRLSIATARVVRQGSFKANVAE